MAADHAADVRPRTTGELLDDAWRLYLADAPLLLALSALFTVPPAAALVLLLTEPAPDSWLAGAGLPAAAAVLLPLSGIGSGACQEVFRRRTEGERVGLAPCLAAALRRGPHHAAARGVILITALLGMLFGLLPGLAVWACSCGVHPCLAAGTGRVGDAIQLAAREVPRASLVLLIRLVVLLFAVLNLHLLVAVSLWAAGNFGGLDTGLAGALLGLDNPVYALVLVLPAWLLLVPFGEAANYLLYVDARVRHETFDLRFRTERLFPRAARAPAGTVLLVCGLALAVAGNAAGAEERAALIAAARQELAAITREVRDADPYPGGERWAGRLAALARRVEGDGAGRGKHARWLSTAVADFPHRSRDSALELLGELDSRLSLLQETLARPAVAGGDNRQTLSKAGIRELLPADDGTGEASEPGKNAGDKREPEAQRPVPRDQPDGDEPEAGRRRGRGLFGPMSEGGLSSLGWLLLAGVAAAVIVAGGIVLWQRGRVPRPPGARPTEPIAPDLEELLSQPQTKTPAELWRRAEELARSGRFPEAVRTLYLAVLATLHRAGMIRYERMRTNGEYLRQIRLAPDAPEELHGPFRRLTALFELKWYGERACQADDYAACRGLAEEMRDLLRGR